MIFLRNWPIHAGVEYRELDLHPFEEVSKQIVISMCIWLDFWLLILAIGDAIVVTITLASDTKLRGSHWQFNSLIKGSYDISYKGTVGNFRNFNAISGEISVQFQGQISGNCQEHSYIKSPTWRPGRIIMSTGLVIEKEHSASCTPTGFKNIRSITPTGFSISSSTSSHRLVNAYD